jgi:hypothetical protein
MLSRVFGTIEGHRHSCTLSLRGPTSSTFVDEAHRCSNRTASTYRNRPPHDPEFLLYPFETGADPACPHCGAVVLLALADVHHDGAS